MPNAYSLKLLNKKYWYARAKGSAWFSLGWHTDTLKTEREVVRAIDGLPMDDPLKVRLFDIAQTKVQQGKITVRQAFEIYKVGRSGLDKNGAVVDSRKAANFKCSVLSQIKRIVAEFGDRDLKSITDTDILAWMNGMRLERMKNGKRISPGAIQKYVYRLSSLYGFAMGKSRRWVTHNPVTDKEGEVAREFKDNQAVWQYKGRALEASEVEVSKLLKAYSQISDLSFFFASCVVMLGCRRRELLTLQVKAVNLETCRIFISSANAKTQVEREVSFKWSQDLKGMFTAYCQGKKPEDFIFSADGKAPHQGTWARKNFERAKKSAKLPVHLTLRDFRHVAAQAYEREGVKLSVIASQLGTSVKLLQKTYLKQTADGQEKELMDKLSVAARA